MLDRLRNAMKAQVQRLNDIVTNNPEACPDAGIVRAFYHEGYPEPELPVCDKCGGRHGLLLIVEEIIETHEQAAELRE